MADVIECRNCDSSNCKGCNVYTLAMMLHKGKLDCLMDEHYSVTIDPTSIRLKALCKSLYALADMVNQFAYSTTFYGKDAVCDGGLSALEGAFWALKQAGCKVNSNGTIQRKNLFHFMEVMERMVDDG